jgi:hypothetical protein
MDELESSESPAEKAEEHAAKEAKDIKAAVIAKAEEIRTAAQTRQRPWESNWMSMLRGILSKPF